MKTSTFSRLFALGMCVASLSACGSDQSQTGTTTALKAVASMAASPFKTAQKPAQGGIGMTRATLANIVTPVDLVTLENTGAQGVIAKIGANNGVETWSSVDNKTLSMRNGIIVASRGFGGDLMSAAVPTLADLRAGKAHTRQHVLLDGEDKPVTINYACRTIPKGAESIVVVERSFATQHLTELCDTPSAGFANEYWIENGGKLRRSRQWISESVGFVVIEHLQ